MTGSHVDGHTSSALVVLPLGQRRRNLICLILPDESLGTVWPFLEPWRLIEHDLDRLADESYSFELHNQTHSAGRLLRAHHRVGQIAPEVRDALVHMLPRRSRQVVIWEVVTQGDLVV